MRAPLTIAVAQPHCIAHDVSGNARAHADAVRAAATRVVVFPELSLTGYELDAVAVDCADPRLEVLVAACADTGTVALVGAPVTGVSGRSHIATLAIDGSGARVAYRKLWIGSDEAGRFSPGGEPGLIEIDGWRLGLAICKDTGVPRHIADTAALGIDAYLAGTVMFPAEVTEQNRRGHHVAATHDIWVAFAGFAGPTGGGYGETGGSSAIWAPGGERVTGLDRSPGQVATSVLV